MKKKKKASYDINSHKMPFKFTLLDGILLITPPPPPPGLTTFLEEVVESQSQRVGRCLSYFSVPVVKYHDQGNLQKRGFSQQHLSSLAHWCTCLSPLNYSKTKIFLDIGNVSRRPKKNHLLENCFFKGKLQMKILL